MEWLIDNFDLLFYIHLRLFPSSHSQEKVFAWCFCLSAEGINATPTVKWDLCFCSDLQDSPTQWDL